MGWTPLDAEEGADSADEVMGGNTDGKKGRSRKKVSGVKEECPASLELRDGSVLAFRFKGSEGQGWRVEVPSFEDEEGEGLEGGG